MPFDPDAYLQSKTVSSAIQGKAVGFDPDAYLSGNTNAQVNASIPVSPGERIIEPTPQPKKTMMDYVMALGEVPYAIGKNIALTPISVAKDLNQPLKYVQEQAYQPKSPVSQEVLSDIGSALEASKLPPYIGGIVSPAMQTLPTAKVVAQSAKASIEPTTARMVNLLRKEPESTLSGVGAAAVPEAVTRQQMAQGLRVPVNLRKGQLTRDLAEQQFETETMKTYPKDVGEPLIKSQLDINDNILRNFDAYVDATGAQKAGEFNLREVGRVVDSALVKRANEAKKEINSAYKLAREAGETSELIDVNNVKNYLDGLEAESVNAPIITSAKLKLDKLAPEGVISINDLEEVRKMVGTLSGSTPTNKLFGSEINKLIDATTENKGGELYRNARKLRANYAKEFENVGFVDKLLSKKPGTTDRSVALEDVFDHAILKGSLDDVSAIGRTLKKAGPEGQQAWRELQGQTIEHLKSAVTKNIQRDANNNPIVSPKQFDSLVKDLDSSGKLDYLFGKSGAQEIRNLRDTAILANTQVPGINTSNTASAMTQVLNSIYKKTVGKIPVAGPLVESGAEMIEKKNIAKKVKESLEYNPQDLANGLRKGAK